MFLFQPDSFVVSDVVVSPNFDDRRDGIEPDMIILHYTGMQDEGAALERLCAADSKVSAHYVVFTDGRIVQCVPEKARAWHAGVSRWAGETDINSRSIGIEIANPGHDFGYPAFPLRQTAAVIAVCKGILTRRPKVRSERVLAHSDVAPERKQDPGEKFPWRSLADSGVGLWVEPAPIIKGDALRPGATGDKVRELQASLARFGYGIQVDGRYDVPTREVVTAFQRHFRPKRVDGIADSSTVETLKALLARLPEPANALPATSFG